READGAEGDAARPRAAPAGAGGNDLDGGRRVGGRGGLLRFGPFRGGQGGGGPDGEGRRQQGAHHGNQQGEERGQAEARGLPPPSPQPVAFLLHAVAAAAERRVHGLVAEQGRGQGPAQD